MLSLYYARFCRGRNILGKAFLTGGATSTDCFGGRVDDESDDIGHGTQVAGVIAQILPDFGARYSAKISFRPTDSMCREVDPLDLLAALNWVLTKTDARSVNISINFDGDDDIVRGLDKIVGTVSSLWQASIIVSAGNRCTYKVSTPGGAVESLKSPGNGNNVITVGASTNDGRALWAFSCFGPGRDSLWKPDLVAPGYQVWTPQACTVACATYELHDGTSYAAPQVTAAAALLDSLGVTDPLAKKALLINSANQFASSGTPVSWSQGSGWGVLAFDAAFRQKPNVTLQTVTLDPDLGDLFFRVNGDGTLRAAITWDAHLNNGNVVSAPLKCELVNGAGKVLVQTLPDSVGNVKSVYSEVSANDVRCLKVTIDTHTISGSERFAIAASQPFIATPSPLCQ
jgi:hypothetical protein